MTHVTRDPTRPNVTDPFQPQARQEELVAENTILDVLSLDSELLPAVCVCVCALQRRLWKLGFSLKAAMTNRFGRLFGANWSSLSVATSRWNSSSKARSLAAMSHMRELR